MGKKLKLFLKSLKKTWSKWSRKKKLILGGVCLVFLILLFSRKAPLAVETVKVTQGDLTEAVSASGNVDTDRKANLSFPAGGMVRWVGVKMGDEVQKGQAIASLDTTVLNAAYQQAINSYQSLNAAAQKAEDDVKDHAGDETFAQKATRMAAQTARDSAYDAMKAAEANLRFATLFAPFAGVITEVTPANAGVNVLPATALYTVVATDQMFFNSEIQETDIAKVAVGQKVVLKLDAYSDETFTGEVTKIGLVAFISSTGGNAYRVRISLPENQNGKFKVGMGGDAEIVYQTLTNVLKVPIAAVVSESQDFVWVKENGRAKKVVVETGVSSLEETEIKSGLSVGEPVFSQPPLSLKEGQRVK